METHKQMGLCGFEWLTQIFIFLPKAIFINFFYGGDTSRQPLNSSYNSTLQKCLGTIILSKWFYKKWEKMRIFGQKLTFYHLNDFVLWQPWCMYSLLFSIISMILNTTNIFCCNVLKVIQPAQFVPK